MIWECHSPSTLNFPFTFLSSEACTLSCTSSLSLSVFAWRLASFPTPHPGTGCLLPLLNMGQIRETFACLFLKREVLNREHSHSIVPFQGDGWAEEPWQCKSSWSWRAGSFPECGFLKPRGGCWEPHPLQNGLSVHQHWKTLADVRMPYALVCWSGWGLRW